MSEQIPHNEAVPTNIDEAIEQCILALESDDQNRIEDLISRFPQWKPALEEFLLNWGGMERVAEQISEDSQTAFVENQSGIQVGDYKLTEQIGSGGMGVIYKAHQLSLDRKVALKMINREETDRERFQIEAEAIAALTHPNIVQVFEIGEHEGRMFFSMQLIEGCNLKQYHKQNRVSPKDAARITEQIARAVHYAHQRGILHRDLKPANVLMDFEGQPHITDFGLAKHLERDNDLTISGAIIGTPAYMAPEQAAGQAKNLTVATDVYGLGAILYALLTGHAPFTGESSLEIIRKVVDQPASSPRIHNVAVGRDLETICLKCLEKAPDLRYSSAAELADDLQLYLSGQPVNARPVPQLERVWRWCIRNPIVTLLTFAVILLLISTAVTAVLFALSEHNARVNAQRGDREKKSLRSDIERAKLEEQKALILADQNKIGLFLSNGHSNLIDGNIGESLLWYAHVASQMQANGNTCEENLQRCKSILNHVAVPVHAIQLDVDYRDIPWGFQDFVELESRGNQALIQVGHQFFVWKCSTGQLVRLNDGHPTITCAKFCPSADQLLIGTSENSFRLLNQETLEVETEIDVDGPVNGLSVSENGELIGVYFDHCVAVWNVRQNQFVDPKIEFESEVEYITFDEQAARMIVVYQNSTGKSDRTGRLAAYAELLDINEAGCARVAEIPCRILKRQHFRYPNRQPFWPQFVKGGEAIMIRNSGSRIYFYDSKDGSKIRHYFSELGDFCFTTSRNGEYYAVGKQGMASLRRVLYDPPASEKPSKEFMRLIHDGQIVEAIVSPNNLVATYNMDGAIKLWHIHESQFSRPCDDVLKVVDQKKMSL